MFVSFVCVLLSWIPGGWFWPETVGVAVVWALLPALAFEAAGSDAEGSESFLFCLGAIMMPLTMRCTVHTAAA